MSKEPWTSWKKTNEEFNFTKKENALIKRVARLKGQQAADKLAKKLREAHDMARKAKAYQSELGKKQRRKRIHKKHRRPK